MSGTKLPTFLIIGAARSGTTTLFEYLQSHPEVFVTNPKEPCFFGLEGQPLNFQDPKSFLNLHGINNFENYRKLFAGADQFKAVGEGSTLYLYSETAPERIKHYLPNIRFIAILRNPVDRAYSNFVMNRRDGRETETDFMKALELEETRKANRWGFGWHYLSLGFYHKQLTRYEALFSKEQRLIFLFEDLINHPKDVIRDMFDFIEVDRDFVAPDSVQANVSGIPKNEWLSRELTSRNGWVKRLARLTLPRGMRKNLFEKIKADNLAKAPKLDVETRKHITALYREDILHLQTLINRDLSSWLEE